jgi:streptomycin 6-kinase
MTPKLIGTYAQLDLAGWIENLDFERLPQWLDWLQYRNHGRQWLTRVPEALRQCVSDWDLTIGQPIGSASTALVVEALLPDGTEAILKVPYVDRETRDEAAAMAVWDGDGAARLLRYSQSHRVMLLERIWPGTPLRAYNATADQLLDKASDVARRTLVPADVAQTSRVFRPGEQFRTIEDEASFWIDRIETIRDTEDLWERRLSDAAIDALRCVSGDCGSVDPFLLNMDLTVTNIIRGERLPWMVVDPKPVIGDPAFQPASLVRAHEIGHSRQEVFRRLYRVSDNLGVDRERARLWSIGHTLAWARWSPMRFLQVDIARWLVDG